MSKTLKKVLITGASLLMFASVGAEINTTSANGNGTDGSHTYDIAGTPRKIERWSNVIGADEGQYNSSFNNALGGGIYANFKTGKAKFVHRHGHILEVVPEDDVPGKIIRVDGHRVYTPHQVLSLMRKHSHHYYRKAKKHARKHGKKHYRRRTRRHAKRHYRK